MTAQSHWWSELVHDLWQLADRLGATMTVDGESVGPVTEPDSDVVSDGAAPFADHDLALLSGLLSSRI